MTIKCLEPTIKIILLGVTLLTAACGGTPVADPQLDTGKSTLAAARLPADEPSTTAQAQAAQEAKGCPHLCGGPHLPPCCAPPADSVSTSSLPGSASACHRQRCPPGRKGWTPDGCGGEMCCGSLIGSNWCP